MRFSRFTYLAFLGSAFTAAALLINTVAFAATSHTHMGLSAQSAKASAELRSAMEAQLRFNPSGRVINSDQISYDQGHVVVTVVVPGVTPDFTCPGGSMCLSTQTNRRGNAAAISGPVRQIY